MPTVTLGYWNIRGFAQPIRLLLAHAGVEYEDKRYNFIGPKWDLHEWLDEKFTLGLDFPNIPYYIDDDVKLSQTLAILKYLGRKHGLVPRSEHDRIRVDLIEAEAMDIRTKWFNLCYGADFETNRAPYLKVFAQKLKEISTFLGRRHYIAGDEVTYIDFMMYELLDIHVYLEPSVLDDYPNLGAYHARIQALPKVAAYINSDKFLAYPITGPMSYFGGN